MSETKFVKGRCSKTNRYFALELKQFGREWKVVNFLQIDEADARLITSEVEQSSFYTNETLLACSRCGSRKVGGCNCAERNCRAHGGEFQCIYCKYMQVDYSAADLGSHREGEVVRLAQGQEVRIQSGGRPINHIEVHCLWDRASTGDNMDVDSSIVVMGPTGYETVYFGALRHPSGCIEHHGDNLTGGGNGETIDAYLGRVPQDRNKLVFVINIYKCEERHQTLDKVRNLAIRLRDPDNRRDLVEYRVDQNMHGCTALVLGVATRSGSGWSFRAEGRSSRVESLSELVRDCYEMYK